MEFCREPSGLSNCAPAMPQSARPFIHSTASRRESGWSFASEFNRRRNSPRVWRAPRLLAPAKPRFFSERKYRTSGNSRATMARVSSAEPLSTTMISLVRLSRLSRMEVTAARVSSRVLRVRIMIETASGAVGIFIFISGWRGMVSNGQLRFADFCIARGGIKRGRPCNVIALPAIQESQTENIGARKPPARTDKQIKERHAAFLFRAMLHEAVGVFGGLGDLVVDGFVGVMEEVRAETAHRPPDFQRRVRFRANPTGRALAPQPPNAIGIPVTVANPAPAVKSAAWKFIYIVRSRPGGNRFGNLRRESGRNDFVGIEIKKPRLRGFIARGILLADEALPRFAKNPRPVLQCDFLR